VWYGKGAERLGLPSDVTKEDFVAIANNRIPQSGERLTARTNDTRTHIVWELDEETQSRVPKEKEVNNRRVCVDFTFSVPKSVSMYLAKTKDVEVEKLIHQALRETIGRHGGRNPNAGENRRSGSRQDNWKCDLGEMHPSNNQAGERAGRSPLALPRSFV
jgi:hypothetical protein